MSDSGTQSPATGPSINEKEGPNNIPSLTEPTAAVADVQSHPEGDNLTRRQVILLMLSLSTSTFIAAVEQTIVATALPTIAEAFKASAIGYTWIGTSYLLPAAAATPTWNKVSDIFGRKPIILLAIFVFFIGSLIAALSINLHMLIGGRVVQGIGGGGILSLSATVIGDVFSPL